MTRTVLQRVDLDPPLEVSHLYYRESPDSAAASPVEVVADGLRIPAGGAVTFDTYFNAFFENYWFGYTNLGTVQLRLEIDGHTVVKLHRQTPETDCYLLDQRHVIDGGVIEFHIDHDDELRVEAGRIWFEVEALGDVCVRSASWTTMDRPQRAVSLGVVFCTFNREKYLQRILRSIDSDDRTLAAISKVFVVNQGDPFTPEEIMGPDSSGRLLAKLRVIEQPNLGGCGGFTRGIYETAADEGLSHFLLMDDDSRINSESVARTRDFMAFCDEDVVVGGHMLNLHRPNRLFEAGALLDNSTLQPSPIHHNIELSAEEGLEPFLRSGAVTYNGWWMFGARVSVVDEIGYPMPCFIRGDDMEYGVRLRDAELRTVPVPGIAVWHEPFYLKLGGWQFFFEVRNRLAMAALHDHADFAGIRSDLRKVFARDIAMSRYHSCKLMIAGIESYLAGPDVALDTTDGPLRAAAGIVSEYGPQKVEDVAYTETTTEDLRHRGELRRMVASVQGALQQRAGKVLLVEQIARRLVVPERKSRDESPVFRAVDLRPHIVAKCDSYVVVEDHGGTAWRFRRNRALERELWRDFLPLLKQLSSDKRYRTRFEGTAGFEDTWRDIFGALE